MDTSGLVLCDSPETSPCASPMLGTSRVHAPVGSLSDPHSHRQMRTPGGHRHFWKGRAARVAGEAPEGTSGAERGEQEGLGGGGAVRQNCVEKGKSVQLFKNTSNCI